MKKRTPQEIETLKAKGRERLPELVQSLLHGRHIQITPHEIRVGSSGSLVINRRTGQWYSHENAVGGDIIALVQYAHHTDFRGAVDWLEQFLGGHSVSPLPTTALAKKSNQANTQRVAHQREKAATLWMQAQPVKGGVMPVKAYLQARALSTNNMPPDLRQHPACYNFTTSQKHPAMLCAMRDSAGDIVAVHQTFLALPHHHLRL